MALRMCEHPRTMGDATGFGIPRAKIKPPDAGIRNRARAHRAGLQGHVKIVLGQAFNAKNRAGIPNREDLGMGGRVVQFPCPVARRGHDRAVRRHHDRAHRHLAARGGFARFVQRKGHIRTEHHAPVIDRAIGFPKGLNWTKPLDMTQNPPPGDRIAKVIARAGLASRRDAEQLILQGRVSVNGKTIDSPALNVTPTDKVVVNGKLVGTPDEPRLWLYHKPVGLVTTTKDEQGRATIFDKLPEEMPRVMSVGRLDLNSEGLLLLTNDGGIKRKLELPSTGWLRKYRVRVKGQPKDESLDPLRKGMVIDGERFQPMIVTLDRQQGANAWLTIGLREGKNREIRRALADVGLTVNRLIRVSYGPFQLGDLKAGAVEELRRKVVRDQLGLEAPVEQKPAKPLKKKRNVVERKPRPNRPGKTP